MALILGEKECNEKYFNLFLMFKNYIENYEKQQED